VKTLGLEVKTSKDLEGTIGKYNLIIIPRQILGDLIYMGGCQEVGNPQ